MDFNQQRITPYLSELEHEYGVAVLGAWDTGSHAWGLSSPDSDYDISFVFTQPLSNYITSRHYRETIDIEGDQLESVPDRTQVPARKIDLMGWDAKRYLNLIKENNLSTLETLHSPIAYRSHPIFDTMGEHVTERFNIIDLFIQYKSLTRKQYVQNIANRDYDPTVKQNLLIARSGIYAEYIRDTHTFPKLDFPTFLEEVPDKIKNNWDISLVRELVMEKQTGNGDEVIGNPFEESVERLMNFDITPEEHIRPENKRLSCDLLDECMESLVQQQLLVR